jgi:hypothetical protein
MSTQLSQDAPEAPEEPPEGSPQLEGGGSGQPSCAFEIWKSTAIVVARPQGAQNIGLAQLHTEARKS